MTPQFVVVHQTDPLAAQMLDELGLEYRGRYGDRLPPEYTDLRAYPADEFATPDGVLLLAIVGGEPVAGGAFRRYDSSTAELKRIWTAKGHRQRGYGTAVVTELERIALQRGYARILLSTGPRQPEAVALYLASGYTPLYDPSLTAESVGIHEFEKHLA